MFPLMRLSTEIGDNMSYNRRRSTGGSRWMSLRFTGKCKVCGQQIPAGAQGFYDANAKTVTCHNIDCCDADGLTTHSPLTGPWDKRADLRVRIDHRIGAAAPRRGTCEDAPCCGCC